MKYPRPFRYRHVPAIPPRMGTQPPPVFEFNEHDCAYTTPQGWTDFLKYSGANIHVKFHQRQIESIRRFGCRVERTWDGDVTITAPASVKPRISAKLLATFPWKLRKYLNSKP